jgi:hypothetical protein
VLGSRISLGFAWWGVCTATVGGLAGYVAGLIVLELDDRSCSKLMRD